MNGPDNTGQKSRTDLLPPRALLETAAAFGHGASHHGERNWEAGTSWETFYGACLRHALAWQSGEDRDPESGRLHMAHIAADALIICEQQLLVRGVDDRPDDAKRSPAILRVFGGKS